MKLKNIFNHYQAKELRVYAIEGCGGPQIGLSLDTPEESDKISVINDIQVAVSALALGLISNLTLDFETEGEQSDSSWLVRRIIVKTKKWTP